MPVSKPAPRLSVVRPPTKPALVSRAVTAKTAAVVQKTIPAKTAATVVQRARLGDQNAMALIASAKQAANQGNSQAKEAVKALDEAVKAAPVAPSAANDAPMPPDKGGTYWNAGQTQDEVTEEREWDDDSSSTLDEYSEETDQEDDADIGAEDVVHLETVRRAGPTVGLQSLLQAARASRGSFFAVAGVLVNGPNLTNERINNVICAMSSPEAMRTTMFAVAFYRDVPAIRELIKVKPEALGHILSAVAMGWAQHVQKVRAGAPVKTLSSIAGWELGE